MSDTNRKIAHVTIVGAGVMGVHVATHCARADLDVCLFDVTPQTAARSRDTLAARGLSVRVAEDLATAVDGADLIFENVPETLAIKHTVHADIDRLASPHALVGTNSSSMVGSDIFRHVTHPERCFNMNFTGLADDKTAVEYMPHPTTSAKTTQGALHWARSIGAHVCVVDREIMGYAQNRIWRAIKRECLFLADRGYATPAEIDKGWMVRFGQDIGPFGIMDEVGLATVLAIEQSYAKHSRDPDDQPSAMLEQMVAAGKLGVQNGEGFYRYPNPAFKNPAFVYGS
jgi:3-hydroxybutyryl-CoA dehydrogenase